MFVGNGMLFTTSLLTRTIILLLFVWLQRIGGGVYDEDAE